MFLSISLFLSFPVCFSLSLSISTSLSLSLSLSLALFLSLSIYIYISLSLSLNLFSSLSLPFFPFPPLCLSLSFPRLSLSLSISGRLCSIPLFLASLHWRAMQTLEVSGKYTIRASSGYRTGRVRLMLYHGRIRLEIRDGNPSYQEFAYTFSPNTDYDVTVVYDGQQLSLSQAHSKGG